MFHTEEQQKKICNKCPLAKTADLIGDSVVIVILRDLFTGPKRFGELETSLLGVSTRTITEKLKILEEYRVISRKEFIGKPPKVEYSLTEKGEGLEKVYDAMRSYGEKYL